jgi:AraC-like DNA-binding protein
MIIQPTIDRDVVVPIVDGIHAVGGDVEALLEEARLLDAWSNPTVDVLPESQVWKLFELGAHDLDLPEIGLQTGSHLRIRDLGLFGNQLEQSLSLFQCLKEYISTVNHYSSHAEFWLDKRVSGFWFCRRGIELIEDGCEYVEQFTLQLMIRLIQLATGPSWMPAHIRLQAETVRPYRDFGAFDSTELEYGHATTAVWIPSVEMLTVIRRDNDDPIIRFIQAAVSIGKDQERPNLKNTAYRLGFSKRTLQRELSIRGLDWSRLLDQIRLQRAIELLRSTDIKLGELAGELGYTDGANFGRAFRRWTGVTPRAYRLHLATAEP